MEEIQAIVLMVCFGARESTALKKTKTNKRAFDVSEGFKQCGVSL